MNIEATNIIIVDKWVQKQSETTNLCVSFLPLIDWNNTETKKGGRQYIAQLTDSAAKTNSVNMKIERCIANIPLYVC